MTSRDKSDTRPLHETLLDDLDQMLAIYDQSVQLMLEAVRHDGYFDDLDADAVVWPKSQSGAMDVEALQFRAQLVNAIFQGLPEVRDARLDEGVSALLQRCFRNITRAAEFICNSGDNLSSADVGMREIF